MTQPRGESAPPPPPSAAPPTLAEPLDRYPVRFEVDYPERLSRWKTLLRLPLIIPAAIFASILGTVQGYGLFAGWIAVFLRRRYPAWLFTGVTGSGAFQARLWAYAALLTDRYPSFSSEGSPVRLEFDEPPNGQLSRWRVFSWKLMLLVPHFFVLSFLMVAVVVVVVIAWFGVLFTGRYPRGIFGFVTGVTRWYWRGFAYFASFNDRFPPYSLSADAGPGETTSSVVSGVAGGLVAAGSVAGIIAIAVYASGFRSEIVNYDDLRAGVADTEAYLLEDFGGGQVFFQLTTVYDPGDDLVGVLDLGSDQRAVVFEWGIGAIGTATTVDDSAARLDYRDGGEQETVSSLFVVVADTRAPARVADGTFTAIRAVFVIPTDAEPLELRWRPGFDRGFKYRFE
jgi:hypothetical protein